MTDSVTIPRILEYNTRQASKDDSVLVIEVQGFLIA